MHKGSLETNLLYQRVQSLKITFFCFQLSNNRPGLICLMDFSGATDMDEQEAVTEPI